MGGIFSRRKEQDITRNKIQQAQPLIGQNHKVEKRNPKNEVTIGKNIFLKRLTDQYLIKRQTREFLGRYFIKFQKINENDVKIGIEGDIIAQEAFVQTFVKCLVQSHMSGYVFIGIKTPLFKELAKVDYSRLLRLQLVKCNINNIEPITWINSDRFQTIYLSKNCITTIHSLAKTRFPNFVSIELQQNFITDLKPITRTMMTAYNPEKKNKFYVHMTFEAFQTPDLTFIFKSQNTELLVVGEKSRALHMIQQRKVLDRIRKLQTPVQIPRQ